MLFVESRFFVFFLVVFLVHWLLPWHRARKVWLLAASYVFYAAWDWRFLGLILASTAIDWFAGRGVFRAAEHTRRRRLWLIVSLAGNLGLLGFFKYYNFFVESAAALLGSVGFEVSAPILAIVLPVGISFYTFQTLSYTLDIHFGRLKPTDSLLDLALFVGFFPQLVAGPIVRAIQFLPQLEAKKRFADVPVRTALAIFFFGFVKKTCFSDHLAPIVDQMFADPAGYDAASAWLGTVLFYLQLYCDFSAYSDMAIGLALLLGFQLPLNFDFPYFTRSIGEFWQHWHITLGSWFRAYVYIPLGGNRRGVGRTHVNLLVVFLLSGLWHGAHWNFVIWGFIHGAFIVLERIGLGAWLERRSVWTRRLYVNLVWILSLTFFRSADVEAALACLTRMLWPFGASDPALASLPPVWWLACLGFLLVHGTMKRELVTRALARLPDWAFAATLGAAAALAMPWVATTYTPFLYFQF
jgi:alginate O-acetyltransferase complex protein AlgI